MNDFLHPALQSDQTVEYGKIADATFKQNTIIQHYNSNKNVAKMIDDHRIRQLVNDVWNMPWPYPKMIIDNPPPYQADLYNWPEDLVQFASCLASELSMSPEDVCLAVIGVIAIASQGRYVVEISPSWKEAVTQYMVMAKSSGSRKSALFDSLLTPLREYQQELQTPFRDKSHELNKIVMQEHDKLMRAEIKQCLRNDDEDELEDIISLQTEKRKELERRFTVSPLPVLLTTNGTIAALEQTIKLQGGTIGICTAEDPFKQMNLRDKAKVNHGILLVGYDFGSYHKPVTNQKPIFLDKVSIAMLVGMQPEILLSYYDIKHLREDGFLNRLTVWFMPEHITTPQYLQNAATVPQENYNSKIYKILKESYAQRSSQDCLRLKLSYTAHDHLLRYQSHLNNSHQNYGPSKGFLKKHPGRVVRLAACLHLWRYAGDICRHQTIDDKDMVTAISLGSLLEAHAEFAFNADNRRTCKDARRVLRYIIKTGYPMFTLTDVSQNLSAMPKIKLLPVLEFLERNQHIRRVVTPSRATICLANPHLFTPFFSA